MKLFKLLLVGCFASSFVVACGNSNEVVSTHTNVDYLLTLDDSTPQSGQEIKVLYPQEISEYSSGYILNLERQKDSTKWVRIARLSSPTRLDVNKKPGILPAKEGKDELRLGVGRRAEGPLPLVLPKLGSGSYRIVDEATYNDARRTIAARFEIGN